MSIAIGAVGPLISTVWSIDVLPFTSPLSATFFATVAATCIGIDRTLGLSSRQKRYISAAFDIQQLIAGFRFKWNAKLAEYGDKSLTSAEIRQMLEIAKTFEEAVWKIVSVETAKYFADSEKSLAGLQAQAEKLTKEKG